MLNEDYKDILSGLLAQQAEFILVGAYAMAAHGFPRSTMDIDIWINPTPGNAERVLRALQIFGAPIDQVSIADFYQSGLIYQIGVAPRRIDILTSITGVSFEEAQEQTDVIEIDGYSINVLSTRHLIKNKSMTGRTKDLADVETLSKMNNAD